MNFPLALHTVTPYVPVPETNDEEWDRLEPTNTFDVLIEQVLHGEYSGVNEARRKGKESLRLRTAGVSVFEVRAVYILMNLSAHCDSELRSQGRIAPDYIEDYDPKFWCVVIM